MLGSSYRRQSISSWAASVVPGSPIPPTPRRASVTSFVLPLDSPKDSPGRPSLTSIGYASAFVHLPNLQTVSGGQHNTSKTNTRSRSFTITNVVPPQPSVPLIAPPPVPTKNNIMSNLFKKVAKASDVPPKAKKSSTSNTQKVAHAPLTQDILLRQFECGKSFNANASAVMQQRARKTKQSGVDGVYRETGGAVYLDEAEKWENERLLEQERALKAGVDWENFSGQRRGSNSTVSDIDSPIRTDPVLPATFDTIVPNLRRGSVSLIQPIPTQKMQDSLTSFIPPPPGKGIRRRPEPLYLDTSGKTHQSRGAGAAQGFLADNFQPVPPKPNMF